MSALLKLITWCAALPLAWSFPFLVVAISRGTPVSPIILFATGWFSIQAVSLMANKKVKEPDWFCRLASALV